MDHLLFLENGIQLFKMGELDRSEYYIRRFMEFEEDEVSSFYMGMIANHRKETERALAYFQKSVVINPHYGSPCNEIGVILLRSGKDRESVYWLKKSARCSDETSVHIPLFNLATLYKIWNRPERSIQYLTKALQHSPDFKEARQLLEEINSQKKPS